MTPSRSIGDHLRDWRQRRRLSQLDLAMEADISARHLSFVETGRAQPSREMVLRLAERLDVPLRERNSMLLAAGYAPTFEARPLDDPALRNARAAVDILLNAHAPFPALAIDRHWTLLSANAAVFALLTDVSEDLLKPPINVLRLSLHPDGLAPRIANLCAWRAHVFDRLRHQIDVSADPALEDLLRELRAYPAASTLAAPVPAGLQRNDVIIPFQIVVNGVLLSFISTTTVFGTPLDVTLSEIAIETFFPADEATSAALKG